MFLSMSSSAAMSRKELVGPTLHPSQVQTGTLSPVLPAAWTIVKDPGKRCSQKSPGMAQMLYEFQPSRVLCDALGPGFP